MAEHEIAAEVGEVVEDVLDDAIDAVVNPTPFLIAGGVVVGLAVGGFAGYKYAQRKLETKYEKLVNEEVAILKEHYEARIESHQPKPELSEVVEELGYVPEQEEQVVEFAPPQTPDEHLAMVEAQQQNAFEKATEVANEGWDYAVEMRYRKDHQGDPFIIHVDEWKSNEPEYEQVTWTYFEADNVICDEEDNVIAEPEVLIGKLPFEKFGHGSEDENIVYVRSPYVDTDYQLIRSFGSYSQEVHGFEPEIKHEITRRRSRFDDE